MNNPLTFRVESSLGAIFISLLSMFFIGLLFISIKNFNSDIDVMAATSDSNRVTRLSQSERVFIQEWLESDKIEIPEGSGYNYLLRKYPDRPWLSN